MIPFLIDNNINLLEKNYLFNTLNKCIFILKKEINPFVVKLV